jgi:hypothetical protein
MSGKHHWNFPAFFSAERILAAEGWDVVNPARIDEERGDVIVTRRYSALSDRLYITSVELTETFDFRTAIERDLELIDGCTAIYLLKGWQDSLGAGIELDRALRLGQQVLVEPGAQAPTTRAKVAGTWVDDDDVAYATDRDELPYPANLHADYIDDLRDTQVYAPDSFVRLLDTGEVRVVDPETGGEKGSKLARFDLIPHEALTALAEHFGRGAEKYEDRNWERGYDWALTFAALNRHLWAWWGGEDLDPETGSPHMAAVAWHAFVALTFQERGLGTDSRPTAVAS